MAEDTAFGVLLLVTGRGRTAKLKSDILLEIQMKMWKKEKRKKG